MRGHSRRVAAARRSRPGNGSPTGRVGVCSSPAGGVETAGVQRSVQQCGSAGSSSRWTDPRDRASRAPRAASRRVSACATSTPAPSSVRSRPGCSSSGVDFDGPRGHRGARRASPSWSRAPTRRTPRSPSTAGTSPSRSAPRRSPPTSARSRPCRRCAGGCCELQRSIIGEGGIVVEGRDIGSVVAPDAEVKVFLTADPSARAARRTAENGAGDGRRRPRPTCCAATRSTAAARRPR